MAERDPKTGRFPPGRGGTASGEGHGGPAVGMGWGGAPKGASTSRITADEIGEAIRALSRDPEHMAFKAQISAEMLAVQIRVAREGEAETIRVMAADKVQDRLNGKALQQTDVTTKGDKVGYVIVAPEEDESPEAWQARQKSE